MVLDGFLVPDREMGYDKRFSVRDCLYAFHSFLRNYKTGGKPFELFLTDACKKHNVNTRLILAHLQMGLGLLNRKQEPSVGIMKRALLLPYGFDHGDKDFPAQLETVIEHFRILYDKADLVEPFHLKDTVVLPKTKLSYVLFNFVAEAGTGSYPDSGCYLFLRHFGQLGRFRYGP